MSELCRSPKWIKLQPFPFIDFSKPLQMNNNEFLVVPEKNWWQSYKIDGIYKYNTDCNQWKKIINYRSDFTSSHHSATLDKHTKSLHVFNDSAAGDLLEFDLNAMKLKNTTHTFLYMGSDPIIINLDDKLHVIGGQFSNKHVVWDQEHKKFQEIHQFEEIPKGFHGHDVIYCKPRKSILMFGGYQYSNRNGIYLDSIYEFSIHTQKWEKWKIKMPKPLTRFGIASTNCGQYVIILGGEGSGYIDSEEIFVYDVKNNVFLKSKIKTPQLGSCKAIITRNACKDNALVFGFVKRCYQLEGFRTLQYLPEYLVKLIGKWICYEWCHFIRCGSRGGHFKINVEDILKFST